MSKKEFRMVYITASKKEEIVFALEAIVEPISLFEPVYNDGGDAVYVMDQVKDGKNTDENWLQSITLSEAMKHTKMSDLVLSEKDSTVKLLDSEMSLDVGAIGKGYAVEKIAERLEGLGLSGIVLDFGGNLKLIGEKPSGKGWNIGIKDPMDTSSYIRKFEFNCSVCAKFVDHIHQFILVCWHRFF